MQPDTLQFLDKITMPESKPSFGIQACRFQVLNAQQLRMPMAHRLWQEDCLAVISESLARVHCMQKQHLLAACAPLTASTQSVFLLAQAGPLHMDGGLKGLLLASMRAMLGFAYPSHNLLFLLESARCPELRLIMPSASASVQAPASLFACCTYGLSSRC